jgi:LCP family protein required for cell wall assembly
VRAAPARPAPERPAPPPDLPARTDRPEPADRPFLDDEPDVVERPVRRSGPVPPLPGLPGASPVRRSGPVPPLPGLAPPPGARRRRAPVERPPKSPGRRRLGRVLGALGAIFGLVALYYLGLYVYVDQSIDRVEALVGDGPEVLAPALQAGTENYLIVGTAVPGEEGPASVSAILASVNADEERAVLVSLPPTALVDTPMCRTPAGELREPTSEAFAAALLEGGPSCMVRAVQQLSGLRVDHYLALDLGRLPGMVDALGGVPVCVVPSPGSEAAAQPLQPGPSEVSAGAAGGFLQPGDAGSDVTGAAVAERMQLLLTATLREAMTLDNLGNPLTLTRFLGRAAGALTLDTETTLGDLRELASALGDLEGDAVQRTVLPVAQVGYVPAGGEEAYVLLDGAASRTLFDSVIDRTRVPDEMLPQQAPPADDAAPPPETSDPAAGAEGTAETPGPEALTVPPGEITLDVLNGTGVTGLAATVADQLRAGGFAVGSVGNEAGTVNQTVVRHGPGMEEQARTVAAAVPGAVLQPSDAIGEAVQLVLGPGFASVVPVEVGAAAPQSAAAEPTQPATPSPEPDPVTC